MSDLQKKAKSRIYFASDFHLGVPDAWASAERERRIVRWLDCIEENAKEIFLLGDVFDFWFEYRDVVPKGYVRLLGKLATMADNGCKIHFVCGNHDLWIRDYFEKDLGFIIHRSAFETIIDGKRFLIGHGDGLDFSDRKYRFISRLFKSRFCVAAFAALHPRWAYTIGKTWSRKSRLSHSESDKVNLYEQEPIYKYCMAELDKRNIDFFVFGHRHLKCNLSLKNGSRYINTGFWTTESPYAEWDGENLCLKNFDLGE